MQKKKKRKTKTLNLNNTSLIGGWTNENRNHRRVSASSRLLVIRWRLVCYRVSNVRRNGQMKYLVSATKTYEIEIEADNWDEATDLACKIPLDKWSDEHEITVMVEEVTK